VKTFDLVKAGTLDMKVVKPDTRTDVGDKITYKFTVTNTSNVTMTNVRVTDIVGGVTISGSSIATMAPGAVNNTTFTGTYTLTQDDIDAGAFNNTATVTGTPPIGDDVSQQASFSQPLTSVKTLDLVKTGKLDLKIVPPNDRADVGDQMSYRFKVTNTGNVTLKNVTVTDVVGGVTITGTPIISMAPGAVDSATFTGTYTLTQTDINAGTFNNTAKVTGSSPAGTNDVSGQSSFDQPLTAVESITLVKTGTLDMTLVDPPDRADVGDAMTYSFTVTNTGNVTLSNVRVTDSVGGVTITGGPIASIDPGKMDNLTYKGSYTITQKDVDFGTFTNTAVVNGTSPFGNNVTDDYSFSQLLSDKPLIGIAKRVVGSPKKVSPGVWDVTYEMLVKNYGNVTLQSIQVVDDLTKTFPSTHTLALPTATSFTVFSVSSSNFAVNWPATKSLGYDGSKDNNLLQGKDSLEPGAVGKITLVVRVIPGSSGPFLNSAVASGTHKTDESTIDISQNGTDPDPVSKGELTPDHNPTNNSDPTPVEFGAHLFDPPHGIKLLDTKGTPIFKWTMEWINDTNIVAINVAVSDGIPIGTIFVDDAIASGYALPTGSLPVGTVSSGVSCTTSSLITSTKYCYFEGPTLAYPRGRIVWQGILGPDLGVTDPLLAANLIKITFGVNLIPGTDSVKNVATIDADLNGNGVLDDGGELAVATADNSWHAPSELPQTGFAPGVTTILPPQAPGAQYRTDGDLTLEIPALNIKTSIVGVPSTSNGWDITWLENSAGYLVGTAYPTLKGNSVITGHVFGADGLPGPFVALGKLKWGDKIIIDAFGQSYTYEVRSVKDTQPDDASIFAHETLPWITLVTCKDYDEKTRTYLSRIVVKAVQVKVDIK